MQIRKVIESKTFPHFLDMIQWIWLVSSLALNLNPAVIVTGAMAQGGLKVVTLFHFWLLFSSAILCLTFYRIGGEEIMERCIIGLSGLTVIFSIVNFSLHFVNNFALLMKATELVAWFLYNSIFSLSVYKISIVFLLPFVRGLAGIESQTFGNDSKSAEEGQVCEEHH